MDSSDFVAASTFEPESGGRYVGAFDESWYQGRGVVGGLVAAVLTRAMEREVGDRPAIRSTTTTFVRPALAGPAKVIVEILRRGRSVTQARSTLLDPEEKIIATATATFARARKSEVRYAAPDPIDWPPPEEVPEGHEALYIPKFCERFEFRQAEGPPPFSNADDPRIGGWCRMRDGARCSAASLTVLLDGWSQAALNLYPEWAPAASIDMTVQLFGELDPNRYPRDAYYALRSRCTAAGGGYADEHTRIYGPDGVPLAFARQLVALFA